MENAAMPHQPEQYYRSLIHTMHQGYVRLQVIFDEQHQPAALHCLEANTAAREMLGSRLAGEHPFKLDDYYAKRLLDVMGRVARTGESERHELSATSTDGCYDYTAFKAGAPEEYQVAVIFEDSVKRHRQITTQAIDKYLTLFNSIDQGFCTIEVLFDSTNKPVDYLFLEVNPAFEAETGLRNATGRTIRELVPNAEEKWFQIFGEVAMTGVSRHFDERADALNRWYDVYAFRIDEPEKRRVALLFNDVSKTRKAEEAYKARLEQEVSMRTAELNENRNLLTSILNTSLIAMSLMEAVRDEAGNIVDFRLRVVNKQLEKQTGRDDLVGKCYAAEYPGIKITGIFDIMVRVMETGISAGMEYFYPYEGLNRWFSCMFVKIDDGIVATNLDISERKYAEEERFKNYMLLQQSEDLAKMGSWDYTPHTKTLNFSDGMYRLFNREKRSPVTPQLFLQYVTESKFIIAKNMLRLLYAGEENFEETLEIKIDGERKILHFKAVVMKGDASHPTRVLGVTMDVTATRTAEEKIRQMQAEQQLEIFKVTLTTQEEERRRISESLYNGLGQVLYAIKMSMNNLTFNSATERQNEFHKAKKYTEDLLADAIKSTRDISHALSPILLEDFGLKAALEAICNQLETSTKFRCQVELGNTFIDKSLELAVFRTVQELMVNTAKHAKATDAYVEVRGDGNNLFIVVRDNGIGFHAKRNRGGGIGLASIRSRVKLLNGSFLITSPSEGGTTTTVKLPIIL
jgi:signal transduction histidine kinase